MRLLFFVFIHNYYRDQRRIDCRLVMLYKVTYDLFAIPASDYLLPNRRQSRHIHSLAYRQIPTLKNYDKYTFFPRTIIHWNALPAFIPLLPTLAQFSSAVPGSAFVPLNQILYLSFNLTNPFFALYKLISPTLHIVYSINPLHHLLYRNPI